MPAHSVAVVPRPTSVVALSIPELAARARFTLRAASEHPERSGRPSKAWPGSVVEGAAASGHPSTDLEPSAAMGRPPAQDARTSELERALAAVAALAILAGVLLRLWNLGAWSLWGDEVASTNLAAAPVSVILTRATDLYPPLYSLFLHFWQGLGSSEALLQGEVLLRTPSALAGIATIGCVAWVALRLDIPHRRTIALSAAALLALSPLHIWYSREARMYAPAALFAAAAAACYLGMCKQAASGPRRLGTRSHEDGEEHEARNARSPVGSRLRVLRASRASDASRLRVPNLRVPNRAALYAPAYAILMLLGIYTAYANVLLWLAGLAAAPVLARALYAAPALPRRYWLAQAAVALGFAPYLPVVAAQVSYGNFGFLAERVGLAAGDPATAGSLGAVVVLALLAAVAALALAAFAIAHRGPSSNGDRLSSSRNHRSSIFHLPSSIVIVIVIAFALLTALGAIPRGLSIKRQLLVFWPFAILAVAALLTPRPPLLGAGWANLPFAPAPRRGGDGGEVRPRPHLVTAGLLVVSLALSLALSAAMLAGGPFEDWRGAAAYVTSTAPHAAVYLQSAWARDAFAYYYRGNGPLYAPPVARGGRPGTWATQPPEVPPASAADAVLVVNAHPSLAYEVDPLLAWLAARGQSPGPAHPFPRYLSVAEAITD